MWFCKVIHRAFEGEFMPTVSEWLVGRVLCRLSSFCLRCLMADVMVGSRVCALSQHLGFLSHRDPKKKLEHIHFKVVPFHWMGFKSSFLKKNSFWKYSLHMYMNYTLCRFKSKTRWNLEGNLKNHFLKAFAVFWKKKVLIFSCWGRIDFFRQHIKCSVI